jgi:hypothetical protein
MKRHVRASMLACAVAGCVSGAAAQEDCSVKINAITKIGDIQAALNCVEGHIANEAARNRKQSENDKKEMLQQIDNLEIESTSVKHMSLKDATNGVWKKIPDSDKANACFLSSVRLPPQGLCQITYQGTQDTWTYNASDIAGAGFVCTATCVWVKVHRKPETAQ